MTERSASPESGFVRSFACAQDDNASAGSSTTSTLFETSPPGVAELSLYNG